MPRNKNFEELVKLFRREMQSAGVGISIFPENNSSRVLTESKHFSLNGISGMRPAQCFGSDKLDKTKQNSKDINLAEEMF